ncbi:Y-family DNA polymerase [Ideonella paludis]
MKRATALALVPSLVLGAADEARDRQALNALAHALLAFSPSVCWQAPHTVLAEVQASLRCFGGAEALWQRMQAALAVLGHQLHWAEAPTALAAAWLAQAQAQALTPSPTPPRLCQPLPHAPWTRHLDELPVSMLGLPAPLAERCVALGLPAPLAERCVALGLSRLGELRAQPRAGLARRLGPECLTLLARAYGEEADPRDWISPPTQFDSSLELPFRTEQVEPLLDAVAVLLQRLAAWARAHQARVQRFELRLQHQTRLRASSQGEAGAHRSVLGLALAEPSADVAHWLAVLRERLAREPLEAPVLGLALHCAEPVFTAAPSGELFPELAGPDTQGLLRLIDRLQARLGAEAVHSLRLVHDHRPECATRTHPVQAMPTHPAGQSAPTAPTALPRMTRPLWLLPQAQALPERQGRPWLQGQPLRLLEGPERIETGWWDEHLAVRDYFIAGLPNGHLCWVYKPRLPSAEAATEGWFLQGWFG